MLKEHNHPVTDHAVLRYLERAMGVDVEGIRRQIHEACRTGISVGAVSVKHGDVRFTIAGGRVTTTMVGRVQDRGKPRKTRRPQRKWRPEWSGEAAE